VNVSTLGIQITRALSPTQLEFKLLSGSATSVQSAQTFTFIGDGIRSKYNISNFQLINVNYYILTFEVPFSDSSYCFHGSVGTVSTNYLWLALLSDQYSLTKTKDRLQVVALTATGAGATVLNIHDVSVVVTATR
jgi:hypothetical protein